MASDMDMCNSPPSVSSCRVSWNLAAQPFPCASQAYNGQNQSLATDRSDLLKYHHNHRALNNVSMHSAVLLAAPTPHFQSINMITTGIPMGTSSCIVPPLTNPVLESHPLALTDARSETDVVVGDSYLYPPNSGSVTHQAREKPPGCRTVFVGGIPENCSDTLLELIFSRFGKIDCVRRNKTKNFAHIRFEQHQSADNAVLYTGYRMRIQNRTEKEYAGRLNVDYADARDDKHEWEAQQRATLRQQRHFQLSPPSCNRFSEQEANTVMDQLKSNDGFILANKTLLQWLDKGECNKRTCGQFYSMMSTVNGQMRRTAQDRLVSIMDYNNTKEKYKQKMQTILTHFNHAENVFNAIRKQRNWDNFTKPQRKNLDQWLKHTQDLRNKHESEILLDRTEVEMDTASDDEDEFPASKKIKTDDDVMHCMSMDSNVSNGNHNRAVCLVEVDQVEHEEQSRTPTANSEIIDDLNSQISDLKNQLTNISKSGDTNCEPFRPESITISEFELKIIGRIVIFLNIFPNGACIESIWCYLKQFQSELSCSEVTKIIVKLPSIFQCEITDNNNDKQRWKFIG